MLRRVVSWLVVLLGILLGMLVIAVVGGTYVGTHAPVAVFVAVAAGCVPVLAALIALHNPRTAAWIDLCLSPIAPFSRTLVLLGIRRRHRGCLSVLRSPRGSRLFLAPNITAQLDSAPATSAFPSKIEPHRRAKHRAVLRPRYRGSLLVPLLAVVAAGWRLRWTADIHQARGPSKHRFHSKNRICRSPQFPRFVPLVDRPCGAAVWQPASVALKPHTPAGFLPAC